MHDKEEWDLNDVHSFRDDKNAVTSSLDDNDLNP